MPDTPLPQLPGELVTHVMRHVDQQQRLGTCSLVCRMWRAAAAAATSNVRLAPKWEPRTPVRLENLSRWLLQHAAAAAVKQLVVDYTCQSGSGGMKVPKLLQLPAAQLQQLQKLDVLQCQLSFHADARSLQQLQQPEATPTLASSSSSSRGGSRHALSSLTSLTSLALQDVELASPAELVGLSTLSSLQQLHLSNVRVARRQQQQQQEQQEQQEEDLVKQQEEDLVQQQEEDLLQQQLQLLLEDGNQLRQQVQLGLSSLT
uniref:F-box domain-containing protein n=1 Tax=Tetradesmus obliquus TaxID=3088 RepID=A0A383WCU0_TETOB